MANKPSKDDLDRAEYALAKAGGILEHLSALHRVEAENDGTPLALTMEAVRDLVMEAHEVISEVQGQWQEAQP